MGEVVDLTCRGCRRVRGNGHSPDCPVLEQLERDFAEAAGLEYRKRITPAEWQARTRHPSGEEARSPSPSDPQQGKS